jgi:hypothetical protein
MKRRPLPPTSGSVKQLCKFNVRRHLCLFGYVALGKEV